MLLGYSVSKQDDYLATGLKEQLNKMWDISDTKGSALRCTEFLAEAVNRNPMNFEVGLMYVEEAAGLSYYIVRREQTLKYDKSIGKGEDV